MQATYVHVKSGKVTCEEPKGESKDEYKLIVGANVLSNQDVNTVSVIATTIASARLIPLLMAL